MQSSHVYRQSQVKYNGTRRRLKILMIVVLCFSGWAAVTLWGQSDQVNTKNAELGIMNAKLEQARQENEAYQQEIIRLSDPEYLEQLIRKDLNMTKPDETLFIPIK